MRCWFEKYAAGSPKPFPWEWLDIQTGTPFERKVWKILWSIPFGEVRSYGWVAKKSGIPKGGAQAVGQANKKNPLPIVIPCHRVVSADGGIGGYAYGEKMKRDLLAHEGIHFPHG
ncbi:MAG: MGMT family protein [Deltaproteobacteria bacterium]|nr:MGMT family protein [Deltaproteobacteria bacterium]